ADMAESPVQRKPGPYHGAWHSSPIDPCRRGAPYTGIPPPHAPRMPIARRLHALAASLLAAASCALAACRAPEPPPPAPTQTTASAAAENGAISTPAPKVVPTAREMLKGTKWPKARLGSGIATVGCDTDYASAGDGEPLEDLGFFAVADALRPCTETGVLRLRYSGKISADFADLVERVSAMADRMEIGKRILDIDSA